MNAPCKDCPKRRVSETYNCHSHCEDYIAFVSESKARGRVRSAKNSLDDYEWKVNIRLQKRNNKRRRY